MWSTRRARLPKPHPQPFQRQTMRICPKQCGGRLVFAQQECHTVFGCKIGCTGVHFGYQCPACRSVFSEEQIDGKNNRPVSAMRPPD